MRELVLKHRKLLAAAAVLLAVTASAWYFVANKAVHVVRDTLVARVNQEINGRLQVGAMDLSLFGQVEVRDVVLFDAAEAQILRVPLLQLSYRMTNLLDGNLDISRIEAISLSNAQLWLTAGKDGWNWENIEKKSEPVKPAEKEPRDKPAKQAAGEGAKFTGQVKIKDGAVYLKTAALSREISDIDGEAAFKEYPAVAVNFQGKTGTAVFKVSGLWGSPDGIAVQSDEVDLSQFKDLIALPDNTRLESGKLKNVKVNVKQDAGDNIAAYADGEFAGLNLAGDVEISEGKGKFSGDAKELQFPEMSLTVSGQQMTGRGKVTFNKDTAGLDFDIAIPDLDAARFLSGVSVSRPAALSLRLTGTAAAPVVAGNVNVPRITASDITVNGISGAFRYAESALTVEQMKGSIYQGSMLLRGIVLPDNKSYNMDVSGSGIDSSKLVDMDIEGPLDFSGRLSGRGEDVTALGNFIINGGKAYGIPFKKLTGNFFKRGSKTDITDIAITTALGTFYPEKLSREAVERARQRLTDKNIPVTKEDAKNILTDKIRERLGR